MYYLRICHEWNLATRRYEDVERLGSVWEISTDVLWMNDVKFTKEVRIKHAMHVQIYKKKNWPIRQSLTVPWPRNSDVPKSPRHILWCGRLVHRLEKHNLNKIDLKNRKSLVRRCFNIFKKSSIYTMHSIYPSFVIKY